MNKNTIHISWNELTETCVKLFRGIPMDIGHAKEASIAISRMEVWLGSGLKHLHEIYNEISPTGNLGINFVIKKPHLLVIEGNGQTILKISEAIDFIKAHTTKHGYVVSHIHDFKHQEILPSLLYKNYTGDVQLSAQVMSKNILTIIQNIQAFNNPQISEYNMPEYMSSKGMITIYGYDSKHFNLFNFQPRTLPNYILPPKALKQKLTLAQTEGITVDKEIWSWVVKKSRKILVPESDRSNSQAG
ncbi:hypothetical protein N9Q58_00075 [Polaribacter sp.]|nr:hypothetical protein [Polaribacter sp.]